MRSAEMLLAMVPNFPGDETETRTAVAGSVMAAH